MNVGVVVGEFVGDLVVGVNVVGNEVVGDDVTVSIVNIIESMSQPKISGILFISVFNIAFNSTNLDLLFNLFPIPPGR